MEGYRIVFHSPDEIAIEPFTVPELGPYGVHVRTECAAVSAGTELTGLLGVSSQSRGYPAYPGYANVGVVETVGESVTGVRPGDRVLTMGRHQSHVAVDLDPQRPGGPQYIEVVPPDVGPEHAAFAILGSVALHGLRKAEPQVGMSAAVFGQGVVGQLLVQLAKAAGCGPVVAVDLVASRLARSRESGADAVVDASAEDVDRGVREATGGRGAELVFDATRTPKTLPAMMRVAALGGKVLIVGSAMGTVEIDAFTELQLKELSIIGCFQPAAPLEGHHTFPWTQRRNRQICLQMMAEGRIRLDHLITHRVPYTSAPDVYAMIRLGADGWLGVVFTW